MKPFQNLSLDLRRIQLLYVALNELKAVGLPSHLHDIAITGVFSAIPNVKIYGFVEEKGLLHHDGNLFSELLYRILLYFLALDQDSSALLVVETEQQRGDGAFARA